MKDYKRLTSEQFNCRESVDGKCQKPDIFCPYRCECERYNRLYNLEDKIERGEIDCVSDRDKEIASLTAENQRLREEVYILSHENDELEYKLERLESENAELKATIYKMETIEK